MFLLATDFEALAKDVPQWLVQVSASVHLFVTGDGALMTYLRLQHAVKSEAARGAERLKRVSCVTD